MAARVPRLDVWGDELGNLDFDPKTGTRYFVVSTITIADPSLTTALLDLRRDLDRLGYELPNSTLDGSSSDSAGFAPTCV